MFSRRPGPPAALDARPGAALLGLGLAWPALALAQPGPAAPAAPVPAASASASASASGAGSASARPPAVRIEPIALPPARASTDRPPEPRAGPDPAAPAPPASSGGPPSNADYVLLDQKVRREPTSTNIGVPPTLPAPLKRNAGRAARGRTIEDLVNASVVSASNRAESTRSAPAMVLVLTEKDLHDRGYSELSEIFDDLPGMDVARPLGDTYVLSYWRGARTGSGLDPYLLMVDGVILNQLFFRDAQMLVSMPISSIERVEITYNPASATYTPNATMGAVNIITRDGKARQDDKQFGTWFTSRQTFATHQSRAFHWQDSTKQVDATLLHVSHSYRLRLTTRIETSAVEQALGDRYEYTKDKYYADKRLWPDSLTSTHPGLTGRFESPIDKRALDGRLYFGNFEVAMQHYSLSTGLGTHYPADRQQSAMPWKTTEYNLYGRHVAQLSANASLTSLVQYRRSNVERPSAILTLSPEQGFASENSNLRPLGVRIPSSASILQEDLSLVAGRDLFFENDAISVVAGVRFQRQNLNAGLTDLAAVSFASGDPFGPGSTVDPVAVARASRSFQNIDDLGVYGQLKYSMPPGHNLHVGVRLDRNSIIDDSEFSVRGGYTGTTGPITTKLLYSQSLNTPGPFDVIQAGQSGLTVRPERAQALTGHVSAAFTRLAVSTDAYLIDSRDVLLQGTNLRRRLTIGADLGAQLLFPSLRAWAYYSRFFTAQRTRVGDDRLQPEGDLAVNKLWGGVTYDYSPLSATVIGRWIGARNTVETNPIGQLPAYFVMDTNLAVRGFFYDPLSLGFRVENVLDTRYAHPGVDVADAGVTPAVFTNAGGYRGSAGTISSLHPQPGRTFLFSLGLDL